MSFDVRLRLYLNLICRSSMFCYIYNYFGSLFSSYKYVGNWIIFFNKHVAVRNVPRKINNSDIDITCYIVKLLMNRFSQIASHMSFRSLILYQSACSMFRAVRIYFLEKCLNTIQITFSSQYCLAISGASIVFQWPRLPCSISWNAQK